MTANHSIDPALFLSEHLERAEPDLLRSMLKTFIDALMGAEADALCGAPYGVRSEERVKAWNENPKPFIWTKPAEQILESLKRLLQRTTGAGH